MTVEIGPHLATLKHGVTRFRITLDCYEAKFLSAENAEKIPPATPMRWLRPNELAEYPLCSTGRKLVQLV
jgi:A/G-specific adenine glycosylase